MKASLQLKNSVYQVVLSYKDENGKHKTKWISTGLKEGVGKRKLEEKRKEIVAQFEEAYNRRLYAPKAERTGFTAEVRYKFTDFLDMWLETIKPSIAHTTYIGYAKNLRKIKGYFGSYNLMLDEVKPIHIQNFYNKLYAEGLSGNSIIHVHANIRKALQYAVKTELIINNPADKAERPKIEKYVGNYYNKDELTELFKIFEGDRMELCVHIAAYYGFRRSEVVGLKWDAVDFKNKTISVKHKITNEYGSGKEILIGEDKLKNASSRRLLPLIPHIEKLLLEEKDKQEHYRKLLKSGWNTEYDGYVCRDSFGNLITPNFVSDHFRFMIKKHKLKKIRFHDLRHSCASLLLACGISMKQIQEWLGHSNFSTTANYYSHLDFNSKKASADTISNALG